MSREIEEAVANALAAADDAPRIIITAGPTIEDIDAVRFLTNRSSGRMGITLAACAAAREWSPLLILGPTHLSAPEGVACVRVRSAADMYAAVLAAFAWCDALIMAAAVADYTPAAPTAEKLTKQSGDLILTLTRTRDILLDIAAHSSRREKIVIGFSLDTTLDTHKGLEKLRAKKLDAILVNTTSAFAADEITATILMADNSRQDFGTISKSSLADRLLDYIERARK